MSSAGGSNNNPDLSRIKEMERKYLESSADFRRNLPRLLTNYANRAGLDVTPVTTTGPKCPICLADYIRPKCADCGHTFCGPCVDRLILDFTDSCPVCRATINELRNVYF